MRVDRLIAIIMYLLEHKKTSAGKLAALFDVSARTIYRDIDALALAGIPIVTYPGLHGGIGVMEGFKVDKSILTKSNLATLLLGLKSISPVLSPHEAMEATAAVSRLIPEGYSGEISLKTDQISIDLTPWIVNQGLRERLEIIRTALSRHRCLAFHYGDRSGRKSERRVEPYQLILKESRWYLRAYCLHCRDYRVFKLSRLSSLVMETTPFDPRDYHPVVLEGTDWVERKIITIKLLFDRSLMDDILDRCGEDRIKPSGKRFMADFPFTDDEYGYGLLLSYGDRCECLAPESVRRGISERAGKIREIYGVG